MKGSKHTANQLLLMTLVGLLASYQSNLSAAEKAWEVIDDISIAGINLNSSEAEVNQAISQLEHNEGCEKWDKVRVPNVPGRKGFNSIEELQHSGIVEKLQKKGIKVQPVVTNFWRCDYNGENNAYQYISIEMINGYLTKMDFSASDFTPLDPKDYLTYAAEIYQRLASSEDKPEGTHFLYQPPIPGETKSTELSITATRLCPSTVKVSYHADWQLSVSSNTNYKNLRVRLTQGRGRDTSSCN